MRIRLREYPELAAVVGPNVPNYQGMFLRGHGSQNHTKNNGSTVGNTATTHASGNLGVVQGDATRNVQGLLKRIVPIYLGGISYAQWNSGGGALYWKENMTSLIINYDKLTNNQPSMAYPTIDASRVTPVSNEDRPINVAVKYIIHAKD